MGVLLAGASVGLVCQSVSQSVCMARLGSVGQRECDAHVHSCTRHTGWQYTSHPCTRSRPPHTERHWASVPCHCTRYSTVSLRDSPFATARPLRGCDGGDGRKCPRFQVRGWSCKDSRNHESERTEEVKRCHLARCLTGRRTTVVLLMQVKYGVEELLTRFIYCTDHSRQAATVQATLSHPQNFAVYGACAPISIKICLAVAKRSHTASIPLRNAVMQRRSSV